jgi:hypothetical protein
MVEALDFLMGYDESYLRKFESSRRFQFSFTDFSLVYRSVFAQIFSRSQAMRKSNTSTLVYTKTVLKKSRRKSLLNEKST